MNKQKKSLIMSAVSLILCLSMLVGTTWAWFTDSVTSEGNRIVSGSLEVDLLHQDDGKWISLKQKPEHKVFDYDRWEPGYTGVEQLKVANLGNLALKYQLAAEVIAGTELTGKDGERLSDVIDVYLYDGASEAESFAEIQADSAWVKAGTLTEMLSTSGGFAKGNILPAGSDVTGGAAVGEQIISVALHMQESAGNEYQKLSVGNIYLTLLATQYTYESDSFDDQYDAGAVFPDREINYSINAPMVLDGGNTLSGDVSMGNSDDGVNALVSAGTLVDPERGYLTLNVTEIEEADPNVTIEDGFEVRSIDVHIDGIAEGNTVPVIILVKDLMPVGLNAGNYVLHHIDNGTPVAMTYVANEAELDAHNEFTYDPATGDVKLALASFSPVVLQMDPEQKWGGEVDYTWYTHAKDIKVFETNENGESKEVTYTPGKSKNPYVIANADQLAGFARIVGGMADDEDVVYRTKNNKYKKDDGKYWRDGFDGMYVVLVADINLDSVEGEGYTAQKIFYPIGYYNSTGSFEKTSGGSVTSTVYSFDGNFNGCGNTIKNWYQNTWDMFGDYNSGYSGTPNHYKDAMGLFGYVYDADIWNLTVENFECDGEFTPTGVIAAYAHASTFKNITVLDCNPRVYNTGNGGIVGIGGITSVETTNRTAMEFENITVDRTNKITALWGSWDVSCSGIMGMYRGPDNADWTPVKLTNCHVAAQIDAYNDVCGNYQYYWYRYSGMLIGSIRKDVVKDGYVVPDTSFITAVNCTVHFGDWNDYYYCELVENSLASYTHDHQFSRLEKIESLDEIKSGGTWTRTGNFYLEENGNVSCYHIRKNADGTLYQHLHKNSGTEVVDGETVLKEDKQCVLLPFTQIYQGYGWGVKNIPVEGAEGVEIIKKDDGYSVDKFKVKEGLDRGDGVIDIAIGYSINFSDIFEAVDNAVPAIRTDSVRVTVRALDNQIGENVNNYYSTTLDKTDWQNGYLRFNNPNGAGMYEITIQDYFYSNPCTVKVRVDWGNNKGEKNTVFVWAGGDDRAPNAGYTPWVSTLTEAYGKLDKTKDGTIVIIGKYTQADLFRAPEHSATVTIKGIDDISTLYIPERTTTTNNIRFYCGGDTVLDNIRIEATTENSANLAWVLVADFNDLTITESVVTNNRGNDFIVVLGTQGGAEIGSESANIKDATLDIGGGHWTEVVGTVRTSYDTKDKADNIDKFVKTEYELIINVRGSASIDKLIAHGRSIDENVLNALGNAEIGKNASCQINLLGGQINEWLANNHYHEYNYGYGKGLSVYVGKDFDLSKSFTKETAQDSTIAYTVAEGMSGESAYYYVDEKADVTGINKEMLGKSVLLVEYVEGQKNRLDAVKANAKVRANTFSYIAYGAPVSVAPTDIADKVYYYLSGNDNCANCESKDGSSEELAHCTRGWAVEVHVTADGNICKLEGCDHVGHTHSLYKILKTGGKYIAVGKIAVNNSTTIGKTYDQQTPILFTAKKLDGSGSYTKLDENGTGHDTGVFIIAGDSSGYTVSVYSEVIFEDITLLSSSTGDSYLVATDGGKIVIRDTVEFAHRKNTSYRMKLWANEGSILYLGAAGYTLGTNGEGAGTIVLSDALIDKYNKGIGDYTADFAQLNAFAEAGGRICDERGITLEFGKIFDRYEVIVDKIDRIPAIKGGELVYTEYNSASNSGILAYRDDVVFVLDNTTISLTDAYNALGTNGGTVVLTCGLDLSDHFTEPAHEGHVTVTQKYGNMDFTSAGTVKSTVNGCIYSLGGDTTFENVTFEGTKLTKVNSGILIVANYYNVVIGEGVKAKGFIGSQAFTENLTVVGGFYTTDASAGRSISGSNITIKSCDAIEESHGIEIVALNYKISGQCTYNANVNITGGTMYRIFGISDAGTYSGNTITFDITGGDFTNIYQFAFNYTSITVGTDVIVNLNISGGTFDSSKEITVDANATATATVTGDTALTKASFKNFDTVTINGVTE